MVEITDITGKLIHSQSANAGMNTIMINTKGVYIVKIQSATSSIAQRLIIQWGNFGSSGKVGEKILKL